MVVVGESEVGTLTMPKPALTALRHAGLRRACGAKLQMYSLGTVAGLQGKTKRETIARKTARDPASHLGKSSGQPWLVQGLEAVLLVGRLTAVGVEKPAGHNVARRGRHGLAMPPGPQQHIGLAGMVGGLDLPE